MNNLNEWIHITSNITTLTFFVIDSCMMDETEDIEVTKGQDAHETINIFGRETCNITGIYVLDAKKGMTIS